MKMWAFLLFFTVGLAAQAQTYTENGHVLATHGSGSSGDSWANLPGGVEVYTTYGTWYTDNGPETIKGMLADYPSNDVYNVATYMAAHLIHRTNSLGTIVDTIAAVYNLDGTVWGEGGATLPVHYDAWSEWVDLLAIENFMVGSPHAFNAVSNTLVATEAYIPLSNSLVYVNYPLGQSYIGPMDWGWGEQKCGKGHALVGSVYMVRALREIAQMTAKSDPSWSAACLAQVGAIQTSLNTNLWDDATGMFLSYDLSNRVHGVFGNALGVVVGAFDYSHARIVASNLCARIVGGKLYNTYGIHTNGYIRELPRNETWPLTVVGVNQKTVCFAWELGVVCKAAAMWDQGAADRLLADGHNALVLQGWAHIPNDPLWGALQEWMLFDGTTGGEPNYPAHNMPAQYEHQADGWFYEAYPWPVVGLTGVRVGP